MVSPTCRGAGRVGAMTVLDYSRGIRALLGTEYLVGTMRSGREQAGLAALRIEALNDTLTCGEATLKPRIPAWMMLPEAVGS